ncbi:lipoprotein [Mycoplasma capricolum subsp. capricolum]|uniref:lipoprotein n=1 Tax=Mycoplasma capricolum TaxID=2095 RepID=UPI003DA29B24
MKKLLTLLGLVTLITTTSAAVIACGGTRSEQKTEDKKEKEDKDKSKEDNKEEKLTISESTKKEATNMIKTMLNETIDSEKNEEISKEFTNFLDDILIENKNNVEKSLKEFKEEIVGYVTDQLIGEIAFKDENGFVRVVFDKDIKEMENKRNDDKTDKDFEKLVKEYKEAAEAIKEGFEEDTQETFTKLKDLLNKDLSSTTSKNTK